MPNFKYSSLPSAASPSIYLCHRATPVMGGDGNFQRMGERGENKKTCQSNGETVWAETEHLGVLHVHPISFEYHISCIYGLLDKTHTDIMRECFFITVEDFYGCEH